MKDHSKLEVAVKQAMSKMMSLFEKERATHAEIIKLQTFVNASLALLPYSERKVLEHTLNAISAQSRRTSLTNSIQHIFEANLHMALTTIDIRNALNRLGFDFSQYRSNPLASITTTLRRMVEKETVGRVEAPDGSTAYFMGEKPKFVEKIRKQAQR
jgi:hypothetical protein